MCSFKIISFRYIILVNCGGTIDLAQEFGLDDQDDELAEYLAQMTVFVADSHRPIDVCNIYNDGQIKLLMNQEDIESMLSITGIPIAR